MAYKSAAPATPSRAHQAKIERMIAKLERYHQLGRRANGTDNKQSTKQFGERHCLREETMRKCRAFARHYTSAELKKLCSLRRRPNEVQRRRGLDGLPLQWGHVAYLFTVADKSERAELQQLAADQAWTAPELYAEIRRRGGKPKRHGGRPVKLPTSATACVRQIITEASPWLRRCNAFQKSVNTWKLPRNADRELAANAATTLNQLARSAEKLAKALKCVCLRRPLK